MRSSMLLRLREQCDYSTEGNGCRSIWKHIFGTKSVLFNSVLLEPKRYSMQPWTDICHLSLKNIPTMETCWSHVLFLVRLDDGCSVSRCITNVLLSYPGSQSLSGVRQKQLTTNCRTQSHSLPPPPPTKEQLFRGKRH